MFSFFVPLQSTGDTQLGFEGPGTDGAVLAQDEVAVVVVVVVRTTGVVGAGEIDGPLLGEMHLDDGIDDQQGGIRVVTLDVQVVQVGRAVHVGLQVLVLIALPGVKTEVLGIEDEATEASEVKLCLRLDAETATHVIVALDDVEVVTLRSAEQDTAEEHTLLDTREGSHLGQREDEARTEAGSLADTVGCELGTVLNGLGIVVVEVLVDTELTGLGNRL